jgi:hypothetical protein
LTGFSFMAANAGAIAKLASASVSANLFMDFPSGWGRDDIVENRERAGHHRARRVRAR